MLTGRFCCWAHRQWKDEVYLHAIAATLKRDAALLLVPEIALTPQLKRWWRFASRDSARAHSSGLADWSAWTWQRPERAGSRHPRHAPGGVAPLPELGLIVVDEEQDTPSAIRGLSLFGSRPGRNEAPARRAGRAGNRNPGVRDLPHAVTGRYHCSRCRAASARRTAHACVDTVTKNSPTAVAALLAPSRAYCRRRAIPGILTAAATPRC